MAFNNSGSCLGGALADGASKNGTGVSGLGCLFGGATVATGGGAAFVSKGLDKTSGISSLSSSLSGMAGLGLLPALTASFADCSAFCCGCSLFVGTAALGTLGTFLFPFSRLFSFSDSEEWSHLISLGFLFGDSGFFFLDVGLSGVSDCSSLSSSSEDSWTAFFFFGFLFLETFFSFRLGLGESSSSSDGSELTLVFRLPLVFFFFGLRDRESSLSGELFFLFLPFGFLLFSDGLLDGDLFFLLLERPLLLLRPMLTFISGERDPLESLRCLDRFLFSDGVLDLDLSLFRLLERPLLLSGDRDRREFRPREGDRFRDLDRESLCFGDLDLERE